MKVTKQQVMNQIGLYIDVDSVDQVGNKQLFVVHTNKGSLLVSYYTVIGVYDRKWYYTNRSYSHTTSSQLGQFMLMNGGYKISENVLHCLINEVYGLSHSVAEHLTSR